MTRQELIEKALDASTLETVREAKRDLLAYIRQHPDDDGIRAAGEQLEMMRQALEAQMQAAS